MNPTFFSSFIRLQFPGRLAASVSLFALAGCATATRPSLPVEASGQKTGALSGVQTYEHRGRLVVIGRAQTSFGTSRGHVDVQLLAADNRVVATKSDPITLGHPRGSQARHGNAAFHASFPADEVQFATKVRVSYHSGAHDGCAAGMSRS